MQWALVFYCVATIFVVVSSVKKRCKIADLYGEIAAYCGRPEVKHTYNFIPRVSQHITLIVLSGQPIRQLPYNAFRNVSSQSSMSEIRLHRCQISHVDAGALLNLHNLTAIDLSSNDITQLDSRLFSDTKQITYIHLQFNNIEILPSGLFRNLLLLKEVSLNDNRIHQVEGFSFQNTPALEKINFGNNLIEILNVSFIDTFENIINIELTGNPWNCNCDLLPLYDMVMQNSQQYPNGFVCEEPATLYGLSIGNFRRDDLECSSEDEISIQDSVITSTEQVPIDTEQPASNQDWIAYPIIGLIIGFVFVLRCALLKWSRNRHVLSPSFLDRGSSRRSSTQNMDTSIPMPISQSSAASEDNDYRVRLPTIIKQRSFRRPSTDQMDTSIPMPTSQSSTVSEDSDSASNTADVDEEQTSIHHCEISEVTTN